MKHLIILSYPVSTAKPTIINYNPFFPTKNQAKKKKTHYTIYTLNKPTHTKNTYNGFLVMLRSISSLHFPPTNQTHLSPDHTSKTQNPLLSFLLPGTRARRASCSGHVLALALRQPRGFIQDSCEARPRPRRTRPGCTERLG